MSLSFESDYDYSSDGEGYNTYVAQLLDVPSVKEYTTCTETNIDIAIIKPEVPDIMNLDYNYSSMPKQLVDALYTEVDWGFVMNNGIFDSISISYHQHSILQLTYDSNCELADFVALPVKWQSPDGMDKEMFFLNDFTFLPMALQHLDELAIFLHRF